MADLFNKKVLEMKLKNYFISDYKNKLDIIKSWKRNLKSIILANEEGLQSSFLKSIFGVVLGYQDMTEADKSGEYTLKIEDFTEIDATKPEGSLGFYQQDGVEKTEAVIELKEPRVSLDNPQKRSEKYYGTPVEQAFSHANKYDGCKWIIVSNMIELRLYTSIRGQGYYEEFRIDELDREENFKKFHFLLSRDNLLSKQDKSLTLELSEKTKQQEENISVEFYNFYKKVRVELFEHLKDNNPNYEEKVLLDKAQKLLDRIIFICFCEDLGVLPAEILHKVINRGENFYSFSETTVWQEIKDVFQTIYKRNERHKINAYTYNGQLFKPDEVLDGLVIKNDFFSVINEFLAYDFDSELDVNILGHIFEQSISDIEEIRADIQNDDYDRQKSKRKKDGIYYAPEYITRYIVENSIGNYLEDIRQELGEDKLPDLKRADTPQVEGKYRKRHLEFYRKYEACLKEIKILDPACGSGAFLNQAFDFLLKEYQWIYRRIDCLQQGQRSIFGLESLQKEILKNNIYGVDINESSVEITKLSLWLKTANKNKLLTNLDDNIKCGNSLVNTSKVAGKKAFDWTEEFPEIMANGGFDVVVGNPPYVLLQNQDNTKQLENFIKDEYITAEYKIDTYPLFIELGIQLIKKGGYLSFITPNTFLKNKFSRDLRKFIVDNTSIIKIVNFYISVFADASVDTLIFSLLKGKRKDNQIKVVDINNDFNSELYDYKIFDQSRIKGDNYLFEFDISESDFKIIQKIIKNSNSFDDFGRAYFGIQTFDREQYVTATRLSKRHKPVVDGGNINRYFLEEPEEYIEFIEENIKSGGNLDIYQSERILVRQIGKYPEGVYVSPGIFTLNTVYNLFLNDEELNIKYVLAVVNSKLIEYFWMLKFYDKKKTFPKIKKSSLENIPIKKISLEKQQPLIKKVNFMLENNKELKQLKQIEFINLVTKYTSQSGPQLSNIVKKDGFYNRVYSGRASKVREMTVTVKDTILTIYADKSSGGSYELMEFEVDNKYQRQYIKYYLENFTNQQLKEVNEFSGGLVKRVLQIEIPDYHKNNIVLKTTNEWNNLQQEIVDLEREIETTDREIDQMIYDLYCLTEDEIQIIEESLE
ncbi:Eco57I restriction-modification methylase domain-containing protein [Sporohalobacter salinus]|uniref:Eco57I restriction-modification methylase domain-containing protein n=1 Tax=Sporohalobacter salinus TaxID=1494606 RepID=UPI00195FCC5E|nr:hypothetical protein [Sporohalobacter salinus]